MNRIVQRTTAAVLALMMALPAMTAGAAYQSKDEIAFSLRGIAEEGCGYLVDGNTVFVTPEAAAEGTRVHIGMYIEAEYADLAYIYAKLQSDSPNITFNEETFINPTLTYWDEAVTYTLEDGTAFSTRFKPYALGKLSNTSYHHDSMGLSTNFYAEENTFNLTWMYGYSDVNGMSAGFLGSRSDEFSFVELDLDIAPDTQAGVYNISFVSNADGEKMGETYVTSDDSVGSASKYSKMVPELIDLRIVVPTTGDANMDGIVDAADAAEVLVYSTAKGANENPVLYSADNAELERFVYYYADVDEHSTVCGEGDGTALNATDAAAILVYAVVSGSGETPNWDDILQQPANS